MRLWRLTALAAALCLLLKLPTIAVRHVATDEVIYWTLAKRLAAGESYSLQGEPILAHLGPAMYDRPLFHHPPLLPVLLAPFAASGSLRAASVVGWLGHLLVFAALLLWLDGRHLRREPLPTPPLLALALLALAVDPILTFVAGRLWIDGLMTGLVALSFAIADRAASAGEGRRQIYLLAAAGLCLGLAGLAKVQSLLVGLVLAYRLRKSPPSYVLVVAGVAAAVVAPWFAVFAATYGELLPSWLSATHEITHDSFMRVALSRPWWYYLAKLAAAEPFFIGLAIAVCVRARRVSAESSLWFWLGLTLGAAILLGAADFGGYQTRFIAVVVPPLYMLAIADLLPSLERRAGEWAVAVVGLCLVWTALNAAAFVVTTSWDEMPTVPELVFLNRQ